MRFTNMNISDLEKKAFEVIRNNPGIVRSSISKELNTSKSTGERTVRSIIDKGLVKENLTREDRRGRSGITLEISSDNFCIICVELCTRPILRCASIDLNGGIISITEINVEHILDEKEMIESIISIIKKNKQDSEKRTYEVIGIGFADPGYVDSASGISLYSSMYPFWSNVPIKDVLHETFSLNTFVLDSSYAKCMAESRYGAASNADNFLLLDYSQGIGLGIYYNNRIFPGLSGLGSEFGHIAVDNNGPLCGCGAKGCIEAVAGIKAIENRAKKSIESGAQSSITSKVKEKLEDITWRHIFESAAEYDNLSLSIIDSTIETLGRSLGNVSNLLNPTLIILGGEMAEYKNLFEPLKRIILKNSLPNIAKKLDVRFSSMSENSSIIGVAEFVIEKTLYV